MGLNGPKTTISHINYFYVNREFVLKTHHNYLSYCERFHLFVSTTFTDRMRCICFSSSESNSLLIIFQYKDRQPLGWMNFFRMIIIDSYNTVLNIRSLEYICWWPVWFTRCFPCVFFFMTSSMRFFTRIITPFFFWRHLSKKKKERKDISFHFISFHFISFHFISSLRERERRREHATKSRWKEPAASAFPARRRWKRKHQTRREIAKVKRPNYYYGDSWRIIPIFLIHT